MDGQLSVMAGAAEVVSWRRHARKEARPWASGPAAGEDRTCIGPVSVRWALLKWAGLTAGQWAAIGPIKEG